MTTYGAYNAGKPCLNENCKSHGVQHPNCECYPHLMAKGGEAIDPSQVVPDQPAAVIKTNTIPNDQVKIDEIQPDKVKLDEIPSDKVVLDSDKYSTPGQLDALQAESFLKGVVSPVIATPIELGLSKLGIPGLSAEDQLGRQKAFPADADGYEAAGQMVGIAGGRGIPGAIAKLGSKATLGAKMIQGAIQNGLFQVNDEIGKTLLEGTGNPEHTWGSAAINIGAAGLFGLLGGAGGAAAEKYIGSATNTISKELSQINAEKYFEDTIDKISQKVVKYGATALGYEHSGLHGALEAFSIDKALNGMISKLIGKPLGRTTQKYVAPAVIKALGANDPVNLMRLVGYAQHVGKGAAAASNAVESLFKTGAQQSVNSMSNSENREKLGDWITNGGMTQEIQQQIYDDNSGPQPEGFAKGGEVKKKHPEHKPAQPIMNNRYGLESHYPDQNVLMNTTKGRISNYLLGLKPQPKQQKLTFDADPDLRTQTKSYNRALDIANSPLSVMEEIKKGTIDPEHIKHMNALYPEVVDLLKSKISKRIVDAQLNGEKPSYKIRQGLSMFMGTALSSETTPANIVAAQSTFANKKQDQQPQPSGGSKGSPKALSKSDSSFLTGSQALARRSQKA